MSIASDLIRGHTDTIILAHLLEGDSYGYKINKEIQRSHPLYCFPASGGSRLYFFLLGQ